MNKIVFPAAVCFAFFSVAAAQKIDTPARAANRVNKYASITNFGDSITCGGTGQDCTTNALGGYDSTSYAASYVGIVAGYFGLFGQNLNLAVSGSQAADQEQYIYQYAPSPSLPTLATLMLGTNDSALCPAFPAVGAGCLSNFQSIHLAEAAYLALPQSAVNRAQGSNCVRTGVWTSSPDYGGAMSEYSTTNGSWIACSASGNVVYIAYTAIDGNGGAFSLTVDGVPSGSFHNYPSFPIDTANLHTRRASFLIRIPALGYGPHTVTAAVTSPTAAGNVVQIDWVGGNGGFDRPYNRETVVGGIPLQACSACLLSTVFTYNQAVTGNVSLLAGDGLNIDYADTESDPQYQNDLIADGFHPNDPGHAMIGAQFVCAALRPMGNSDSLAVPAPAVPLSPGPNAKFPGPIPPGRISATYLCPQHP
jgi:lysophospholipase L1-like esterase